MVWKDRRTEPGMAEAAGEPADPSLERALSVADEVWVAAALLHREQSGREDFSAKEIAARAGRENITGRLRPGVYVHASQHCVANRPPNPGRSRMLLATGKARRRLFRPGDAYHPAREGSRTVPERGNLPARYRELLDWYAREYVGAARDAQRADPLLAIRGLGKEIWKGEGADDYVRRLRRGWS